ncbi:phytoene/squalene synthase family protein [Parvularcula sp. ZS-1/3]|uniref:Phytoene/squalene synthase family protein n=1 Tax=Parvularcula mediterranea TaxID=2732508 RepID=A0A7Y3RJF8_9PROT|nr:phytoene/squalene synthase family protein [Parvularcula mediterranea]NNU15184.1 phytoene/squalene synthase family protein [Parvularcula mediterranea]
MDGTLAKLSSESIAKGSKSFAIASLLFRPQMKRHAHMLYAWCRFCDDVIDGQNLGFGETIAAGSEGAPDADDLRMLWEQTEAAYRGDQLKTWQFDAFQQVVLETGMPKQHPLDLLRGFEMDVAQHSYDTLEDTLKYSYHVAGVVGVMMAIVMGVSPDDENTLDRASDLGIAFQLTNICRDVIDDAAIGRIYVPGAWLEEEGVRADPQAVLAEENREAVWRVALRLLGEADRYYQSSGPGVRRLPIRAGFAVAAARGVYRDIGRVVRTKGPRVWDKRARTSGRRKLALAGLGCLQGAGSKSLAFRQLPPRGDLWKRPSLELPS